MTRFFQEFFWMPDESVAWVQQVQSRFDLWIVLWRAGRDARLIDVNDLRPEMFHGIGEDRLHIFLGSASLSSPHWRAVYGRDELDFPGSYAVQFVPSVITADGNALLQGRLAILRLHQYDDPERSKKLVALFRLLRATMKEASDSSRVIVQELQSGKQKVWKDVLAGKAVGSAGLLRLKQFEKGEVVLKVESASTRVAHRACSF